jgi:tetratricopeptide (TPR) repeat protein
MGIAFVGAERTSPEVVRVLREDLARVSSDAAEENLYAACPFGEGFAGDIGHVIHRVGHGHAKTFVLPLVRVLSRKVEQLATLGITWGTLQAGFARPHDGRPLSDLERATLAALFYNDDVWTVINNTYAFDDFGLPSARGQVGELLGLVVEDNARGRASLEEGIAQSQDGRVAEALPKFEEAVRLWPQQHIAWVNLAWGLRTVGRIEESLAVASRAIEVFYDFMPLHCEVANALALLNRNEEAVAAATRGLERGGDDANTLYSRACGYARCDRLNEAIADLQRVLALEPSYREAIAGEADFAPLASRDDFRTLVRAPEG